MKIVFLLSSHILSLCASKGPMQKEWWRLWEAPWLAQETSESFLFLVTGQLISTLLEVGLDSAAIPGMEGRTD